MEELKKRKHEEAHNLNVSVEKLRSLLDPLAKPQLIDLLSKLKLFVRGLAWNTTSETLCAAFEVHGEVEEGAVIFDKITGKSRGYGFITYKNMASAQEALGAASKLIDGRMTVCNLACEGLGSSTITPDQAQRKLYIGGLAPETTTQMLLSFFSKHGEIEEGSVAYDKDTNISRGFGFVTYKTLEATKKALDDTERILGGRNITVKYADTKSRAPPNQAPPPPVPMVAPPSMMNPYPQTGPNQAPTGSLGLHYGYTQSVQSYPPATTYPSPPVVSIPPPYVPPPQFSYGPVPVPPKPDPPSFSYLPAVVPPKQDSVGIPPNVPMGVHSYPYYMC
ncbi:hypothetical protein vseg_014403 [Gypsophila vaccaria]